MSESCAKVLETLKLLLSDPNAYNPFCIGTSEMFWKKIKTEGLQPVLCSASGQCADSTYEDVGGRSLTRTWIGRANNKMCSIYARKAVQKSAGKPLNITFNTQLTSDAMRPSKDHLERGFDSSTVDLSDIPQAASLVTEAKSVCTPDEIKRMIESLPEWSKSFIGQKSANLVSMTQVTPISIENVYEKEPMSEQWSF